MFVIFCVEDFIGNVCLFFFLFFVVIVEFRQFFVMVYFNKRIFDDYLYEVFCKVCKIYCILLFGGILVFVIGQVEVYGLCKKLKRMFFYNLEKIKLMCIVEEKVKDENFSDDDVDDDFDFDNYFVNLVVEDRDVEDEDFGEDIVNEGYDSSGFDFDDSVFMLLIDKNFFMFVFLLYLFLLSQQQVKVFQLFFEGM